MFLSNKGSRVYWTLVQYGDDPGRVPGNDLEAQNLLGVEGFADGLRHLVTKKQPMREIPKGQRSIRRPTLDRLFAQRSHGKTSRDRLIAVAVTEYGYGQENQEQHHGDGYVRKDRTQQLPMTE
jgi:hypothetical protein